MDQDAFRDTYRQLNSRPCAFERGMLIQQCRCRHAQRLCIAEREAVGCTAEATRVQCVALLRLLKQHARFALAASRLDAELPFGSAMRIQVGGLHGLRGLLGDADAADGGIPEVAAVIDGLLTAFGRLDDVPYDRVMPAIASYRGRRRRR